jgi:hypothetical protein
MTAEDRFGSSVSGAGDVNGDGFADLVVGAPYAAPGGRPRAGTASVFLGSATGTGADPQRIIERVTSGDESGHSVSCAGDVNSDSCAELAQDVPCAAPGARSQVGVASVSLEGANGVGSSPQQFRRPSVPSGNDSVHEFRQSVSNAMEVHCHRRAFTRVEAQSQATLPVLISGAKTLPDRCYGVPRQMPSKANRTPEYAA